MVDSSIGFEGLYNEEEQNFDNVVPEFGVCGGDTMDAPSLQPDDTETKKDCSDCSCKEETKEEAPVFKGKMCYKCKEQRATIKIKLEPSCNECFQYN